MLNMNENKKILVVDDEPDIRELVKAVLVDDIGGVEFYEASNGAEALDKAREVKPDLIIMDIMMPKLDGLEACRRLREDPNLENIPVIILTVKSTYEAKDKGFSSGADLYVTKPFDPEELKSLVEGVLTGKVQTKHSKG
jgi:CheY-like chemotaxis protein